MRSSPLNQSIGDDVAQQAAQWFICNQNTCLEKDESEAFMAWLKASPVHIEQYLRLAALVRDLPAVLAGEDIACLLAEDEQSQSNILSLPFRTDDLGIQVKPRSFARYVFPTITAVLASLLAIVVISVFYARDGERFGLARTYATVRGEQHTWLLPDGSVVHLNSDSAVRVRYTPEERVVELLRGEGLFQVTHELKRRFRVSAGNADVIAIGTEFDVYRRPQQVTVTVAEGNIAVFTGKSPPPVGNVAELPASALRVHLGQQVNIPAGVKPMLVSEVKVEQASAWLRGQIVFERRRLNDLVEEFNRYGRVPIVIEDNALKAVTVSGVFNAYDMDSLLNFLRKLDGVVIEMTPSRITIKRQLTNRASTIATLG
jgi:transmembrane sensor